MTDFEKAVRYMCLCKTDDKDVMIERYTAIEDMMYGNEELVRKYANMYDNMLSVLCN